MFSMPKFFGSMWGNTSDRKETLREKIEKLSDGVKTVLHGIDDTQLLNLTRENLYDIAPGDYDLQQKIMALINEAKKESLSGQDLANSLRDLIERDNRGEDAKVVMRNYLHTLKEMENYHVAALDLLRPHIKLLETLSKDLNSSTSAVVKKHRPENTEANWTLVSHPERFPHTVKVHLFLGGKTLEADTRILSRLKHVEQSSLEHCSVILLFCTIASRASSDIHSAIQKLKAAESTLFKPVIMILLHNTLDLNHPGYNPKTSEVKIVAYVNVLIHDSLPGLLHACRANNEAIAQIQTALQQFM